MKKENNHPGNNKGQTTDTTEKYKRNNGKIKQHRYADKKSPADDDPERQPTADESEVTKNQIKEDKNIKDENTPEKNTDKERLKEETDKKEIPDAEEEVQGHSKEKVVNKKQ